MSRGSVRTWFFTHVADLCRKPPSLTWWSECRTSDWTPATHTLRSFARSESVKAMAAPVVIELKAKGACGGGVLKAEEGRGGMDVS